jgi:hypothetical protein
MTRAILALAALCMFSAVSLGQNPLVRRGKAKGVDPSNDTWSRVTPSESMWMYEQHKRDYLDPQLAMRRRAEHQAWQRRYRLAHMNWYGLSNSRPSWHPTPCMTAVPSPSWTGNDADPYRWYAAPYLVRSPAEASR